MKQTKLIESPIHNASISCNYFVDTHYCLVLAASYLCLSCSLLTQNNVIFIRILLMFNYPKNDMILHKNFLVEPLTAHSNDKTLLLIL